MHVHSTFRQRDCKSLRRYTIPASSIFLYNIKFKLHPHSSDTSLSVDVQLKIEALEFLVDVTAYC